MAKFVICCFILLFSFCRITKAAQNSFKGFGISGQTDLYHSSVKAKDLPIGQQWIHTIGGNLNYYAAQMNYAVFFNHHKSISSPANGLLLYRDYKGYECGATVKRTLGNLPLPASQWGCGVMLWGNYDRYTQIKQYLVYSTVGIEIFVLHNLLNKNIVPLTVSIPLAYAFRQAGHYFNVGISLQIGLCIP
jgi:hypothetical protein